MDQQHDGTKKQQSLTLKEIIEMLYCSQNMILILIYPGAGALPPERRFEHRHLGRTWLPQDDPAHPDNH